VDGISLYEMFMKLLPPLLLILSVGFGILAFVEIRKAQTAIAAEAVATAQLTDTRGKLQIAEERLAETKKHAELETEQIAARISATTAEVGEQKKLLAEALAKLEDAKKQVNAGDEAKNQVADLSPLKEKIAALETQLATSKQETAASRAEVARMQQAAARPALGTAMDARKR
jgi:chromosome segregation ATPase